MTPISIPAMVREAAGRFAEAEAVVDGDQRWTYAELGERVEQATRAMIAAGLGPADRAAIWAPNAAEWIVAALGVLGAGGVVVPLNTRFKGDEAADILLRSGARLLFTVSGFLDTDYVAMLRDLDVTLPRLERTVVLRGDAPEGTQSWADFLAAGDAVDPGDSLRRSASSDCRRNLGSDLHVGNDGAPQGRHHHARADAEGLRGVVRPAGAGGGRPLPDRQPVLSHLRLQGRLPRRDHARGDHRSPPGVRRRHRVAAHRRRTHHRAPRSARAVPVAAQPPRPCERRHLIPAARCHRCGSRAGRADPAHERGPRLRHRADGVRPHRGHGGRHHVPPRRRCRDRCHDVGLCDPRDRGRGRWTTAATQYRRVSRARSWSAATT